jgi:C1A family cysteine protease
MSDRKWNGCKPDVPDPRDWQLRPTLRERVGLLPSSVDLRRFASPVEDQGDLNSCTGNAMASALELLDRRGDGRYLDRSRLFLYYYARLAGHCQNVDGGATIRDVVKVAAAKGCPPETSWPYRPDLVLKMPDLNAVADAMSFGISAYFRLSAITPTGFWSALSRGFPVVFGAAIYQSFERVGISGMVPMPRQGDTPMGGHALLAVGYDKRGVIVRNSWGPKWGDKGYCVFPRAYLNPDLVFDAWAIEGIRGGS